MMYDDRYEEPEEFLTSEQELKKEIARLKRQIKKEQKWHDQEVESLREQIRDLLAKNMELSETCNLFAKGLDNLKKDTITVTTSHHWLRRGSRGLKERIADLALDGKRIVSIAPLNISPQGDTMEALIVTEHIDRTKPKLL